jgi:hypothetical protein
MKGTCTGVVAVAGTVLLVGVSYILANEPKGEGLFDYSGVTGCITHCRVDSGLRRL